MAKPFTGPLPRTMRITAVIITDVFASKIVSKARRKPDSMDMRNVLPSTTSSLNRSKIRIFASTATPILRIIPATPGKVMVAFKACGPKIATKINTNTNKAIVATNPDNLYKTSINTMIKAIPTPKATTDLSLES